MMKSRSTKLQIIIVILLLAAHACQAASPTRNLPAVSPNPASALPSFTPGPTTASPGQPPWWRQAVFYEIFVRSFYDTNGDGIGDFDGITQKLDYLHSLGVTALWLMPIQTSPSYHGYDVINYYNLNPQYGTFADFQEMLQRAHELGMHVIIDLVLNHTSRENPWFVSANRDPGSPYRNWYIWSDTQPGYTGPLGTAWHPGLHGYYYGVFGADMPDLNYTNPEVTREMENVVHFWLKDVGVDGFRLDAVKYLIEEGQKQEDTPSTHAWLKQFFSVYKADDPQAFTVGEVSGAGALQGKSYTYDQMDEIFNFELAGGFVAAAQRGSTSGISGPMIFVLNDMPDGQFATFLTNHDQNRVMSVLGGSVEKAKVAAALMLTFPGTPFIYYGEEIGMQGEKPDQNIRLPMQWTGGPNAGFTSGTPWRAPREDFPTVNVEQEESSPDSLLAFYRQLIALRGDHPALQQGSLAKITTGNAGVYCILRSSPDENILVLINLSRSPVQNYALNLVSGGLPDGAYRLSALLGMESAADLEFRQGGFQGMKPLPRLEAYSIHIFLLTPAP